LWLERVDPKRSPGSRSPAVLAVRVANDGEKQTLLGVRRRSCFFTEPHYNGLPGGSWSGLAEIAPDELEEILTDAWRCQATEGHSSPSSTPPRS